MSCVACCKRRHICPSPSDQSKKQVRSQGPMSRRKKLEIHQMVDVFSELQHQRSKHESTPIKDNDLSDVPAFLHSLPHTFIRVYLLSSLTKPHDPIKRFLFYKLGDLRAGLLSESSSSPLTSSFIASTTTTTATNGEEQGTDPQCHTPTPSKRGEGLQNRGTERVPSPSPFISACEGHDLMALTSSQRHGEPFLFCCV